MDFEGKCIQFLGETGGTSKAGNPWKKKEWLMETFGQYPRKVKVQCFGDKADSMNIEPGKDYRLSVDLESREYNGRWYTEVSVFRVEEFNNQQNMPGQPQGGYQNGGYQNTQPQQNYGQPYGNPQGGFGGGQTFSTSAVEESDEDLPF